MTTPQSVPPPRSPRRLVRSRDDRMIAGVCSGVARYFNIDVTLVRVLTVVGAVFGVGSLVVAYVIAWILMPEE